MDTETKMLNIRMRPKEVELWKKEAKKRDLFLGQFVRQCVRAELQRTKSLPSDEETQLRGRQV
jgi:hypothetical protein